MEGVLPPVSLKVVKPEILWSDIWARIEVSDSKQMKSIVSPTDYNSMEVKIGKTFYLGRTLDEKEK